MSPILFNLVIKVFAIALRRENTIASIKVAQIDYKLALYADDIVVFFLNNLKDSVMRLQDLLGLHGRVSGYKINQEKSHLMGVNIPVQTRPQIEQVCKIRWEEEGVRDLGTCYLKSSPR